MKTNKYKKALSNLSFILNSALETEESFSKLLEHLKNIIEFDYGAIYYVNADRINLKTDLDFSNHTIYPGDKRFFDITEKAKKDLFTPTPISFNGKSAIAKDMGIANQNANFILAKLMIRETIFGFILLGKLDGKKFEDEDIEILDFFCSVASYAIKDNELSNVFKIQLKALQESIIEKSYAYKTIKEQNQKILEADKAKNEFIANISHELRTPLNAIIGFSDVLKSEIFGQLNKKQLEYISDINSSGIHLLGMINEILDLAKIESKSIKVQKSDFNLNKAVIEVMNIVKPLAHKKKIKIEKDFESEILISADYQKIQQILFNLLSNAIKFTPDKGKISVNLSTAGKKVLIKVKDTGIGIAKKYQGKIFGKFVQLNSTYTKKESSTGLGLTITKELVELHGGKISLESKINEGSTFTVELPIGIK